jgi:hypothetical protein
MSQPEQSIKEADGVRRTIFIVAGLVAALLIAVIVFFATRPVDNRASVAPQLEGAIRPGSSKFDEYREKIVVNDVEAFKSPRALGDQIVRLQGTVRNFTGRTINGLEIQGTVVDSQNNPVKQRTIIAIPSRATGANELVSNRTMQVVVLLEGIKMDADLANFRIDVAGVRFQ